jgi:hypothetical protein
LLVVVVVMMTRKLFIKYIKTMLSLLSLVNCSGQACMLPKRALMEVGPAFAFAGGPFIKNQLIISKYPQKAHK